MARSKANALVHIGTSGWHYQHWRGAFYPRDLRADQMLRFYADRFDTVEINNSFYRLPATTALEAWRPEPPPDFCFAVKASRYITHNRKLKYPEQTFDKFFSQVRILKERLGPILFQLPPSGRGTPGGRGGFLSALPGGKRTG